MSSLAAAGAKGGRTIRQSARASTVTSELSCELNGLAISSPVGDWLRLALI